MLVMGIETSCDETAVAIVSSEKGILSHLVRSQLVEHAPYGGVVPEIAARAHTECLHLLITQALREADLDISRLDAIAATAGPGLIGGVLVGTVMAKAVASSAKKPFLAINHLEGHALVVRMDEAVDFPFLLLLISGGHCQFLLAEGVGRYRLLGKTLDDALGEAFDKVAKMMGLGYPGGPMIEKAAQTGDATRFHFPTPLLGREGCDFSFSGLKTAVKRTVDALIAKNELTEQAIKDIAASFQYTVGVILADRFKQALQLALSECPAIKHTVIAGGVAANVYLKTQLHKVAEPLKIEVVAPPLALCTDNAAMIAWAGIERLKCGMIDGLDFAPRARWPLAMQS